MKYLRFFKRIPLWLEAVFKPNTDKRQEKEVTLEIRRKGFKFLLKTSLTKQTVTNKEQSPLESNKTIYGG